MSWPKIFRMFGRFWLTLWRHYPAFLKFLYIGYYFIFLTRCMMYVNTHLLLDFCFFSWCTITPVFLLSIWQTNLFQYGTWRSGKERLYERIKPSQTYRSMMKKDAEDVFGDDRVRVTTILVCSLFLKRHTVTLSK